MAVVSEGTFYQAKIAPSYVSSSGYYGYVPPCPIADYENVVVNQHKLGRVGEANDQTAAAIAAATGGLSWSLSVPNAMQQPYLQQQQHNNQRELICFNGSAMETDDDDNSRRECVRVSRCENNRCVIPEAAGLRLDGGGGGWENVYRVAQHDEYDAAAARRRGNRKRNSAGDPAYLFAGHPANITKRPRQDGGNGNVHDGAGRAGKRGSTALHYEPRPLSEVRNGGARRLSNGGVCASPSATLEGRLAAAGNYDDSIGHSDLERPCIVTPNGHDYFGESYLDYERMLMETHGCSAYHYHRHRHLEIGVLEAEF